MSVRWGARSGEAYVAWDKRFVTEADFVVRYDIASSGEWATLEINGAIGLVVDREFLNQYTILSSVYSDFDVLYQLEGEPPEPPIPVYQDFTLVYAIDSTIQYLEVYRDFPVRWQSAGVVIADFPIYFQINQDTAFPGWSAEPEPDDDWTDVTPVTRTWTPATQPATTWN